MTIIKICGLSEEATLRAAVDAGTNMVGFVHFPKSPRHVLLEKAASLKTLLPAVVKSVMVVVDPDDALLENIIRITAPDFIQLHGDEPPARVAEIRRRYPTQKLIKALPVSSGDDIAKAHAYTAHVDMLMFDAKPPKYSSPIRGEVRRGTPLQEPSKSEHGRPHPVPTPNGEGEYLPGGNGLSFDWALLKNRTFAKPWLLSGGLNPDNVQDAITQSGAQGVDVSSGVESAPGIKDTALIRTFIKQVIVR